MPTIIYFRKPLNNWRHEMGEWDWQLYPETDEFVSGLIGSFMDGNGHADVLRSEIENTSSTRFIDWVDSMEIPEEDIGAEDLERIGYVKDSSKSVDGTVFNHPGSSFPIILRTDRSYRLSIGVDLMERFLDMSGYSNKKTEGEPNAPLRKVELNREGTCSFFALERHGGRTFDVEPATDIDEYESALKCLAARKRVISDDREGMDDLKAQIEILGDSLERSRLADAFFRVERDYWRSRNRAGAVQFGRQDRLGLGWGNHDHHTFRCSRENFADAIGIFGMMGMARRERFFAGAEAGWGAQVMEQPDSGLVVFADVDLGPDEVGSDFTRERLEPLQRLGTVGLWVGLHGESLLGSGMHHLALGSDFRRMREDLTAREVNSMAPFSEFQFLKQSFTVAEHWIPPKWRVERLLRERLITDEQSAKFMRLGALGSHLETIQRDQGFKGFNQSSVSAIIRMTNPLDRPAIGA